MDTIVATLLTGIGVTLLTFVFNKFNVSGHTKRAIVFALCVIGAIAQLAIMKQLNVSSDPATWFLVITGVQGVAQSLYGALAKALKLGTDGENAPNPT